MRPVDNKTRENIIAAKNRSEKRETISLWLGVSISTIDKVWRRFVETGSFLATPYTGRKSNIDTETDGRILEAIRQCPDISLTELIDELSLPLSPSGLFRKLNRVDLSYKKRRSIRLTANAPMYKRSVRSGGSSNPH